MKSSTLILAIIALLVIIGGGWYFYNFNKYAPSTYVEETTNGDGSTSQTTINTSTGTSSPGSPSFTLSQIATHKDATSCYSTISGKVYDLTMWVNMHPGGSQAILSICGIDGTQAFMNQHHGAKRQMDILARYYIGTLSQ